MHRTVRVWPRAPAMRASRQWGPCFLRMAGGTGVRPMIARRLLPASPSSLLDRQDRAITSARPRSVSRHVGRPRRRNHDGRATRTGGLVKADRIVGGIRRHPSEGAVGRLDQRDPSRRVVNARLRQGPGDDHTRSVDTEMQLLPASPPPSSEPSCGEATSPSGSRPTRSPRGQRLASAGGAGNSSIPISPSKPP